MNKRLIKSMLKFNLMFIGGVAAMGIFLNWAANLPGPWGIVVIFGTALLLANVMSYLHCEADRKHIAACKKKGIEPTIFHPM